MEKNISSLTTKQLNDLLSETEGELARRTRVRDCIDELLTIVKRYKLTSAELETVKSELQIPKSTKKSKIAPRSDKRSTVKPKYTNVERTQHWTGRGRPPKWVLETCKAEKIDLLLFKSDDRYKIEP